MKKNVMLKIASVLMVAVLLTTCAISSTFAKYVTQTTEKSTIAQVAHWGIKLTAETPDLFDTEYASGDKTYVASSGTHMVVAPGTKNLAAQSFKFTVQGKPEVMWKLTADISVELDKWEIESGYYCPVVFYVNGSAVSLDGVTDADGYEKAIENAIAKALFNAEGTRVENSDSFAKEYDANTGFENETSVNVTWEWPFETSADNNEKDTALGDASDKATISIKYKLTAEQLGDKTNGSTPAN